MMTSSARLGIVRSTFTPAIAALAARSERVMASASGSATAIAAISAVTDSTRCWFAACMKTFGCAAIQAITSCITRSPP